MPTKAESTVELGLQDEVDVPYTVEDAILMSPGTWNNLKWKQREIANAASRSDFDDQHNRALFSDHEDRDSRHWIGTVDNIRMQGEDLVGDLEIVDPKAAMKLEYGAKFGVSPKVVGNTDGQNMRDFTFENFSLVFEPAVKTTYLNSKHESEADVLKAMSENELTVDELRDDISHITEADTMPEDDVQAEEAADEPEEVPEADESAEEVENSLPDDVSDFQEFAKEMKEENPEMSMTEIAEEFEEQNKSTDEKVEAVKNEVQSEIEDLKQTVASLSDQLAEGPQSNEPVVASQKTGDAGETKELSGKDLDRAMTKHLMKKQGNGQLLS